MVLVVTWLTECLGDFSIVEVIPSGTGWEMFIGIDFLKLILQLEIILFCLTIWSQRRNEMSLNVTTNMRQHAYL